MPLRKTLNWGTPQTSQTPVMPQQPKQDGLVTSMVKGVVSPIAKFGSFAGEAVAQTARLFTNPTMLKASFAADKMTDDDWSKLADSKETFIMKDSKAIKDPTSIAKTGLKRTAGAAAYAVPGGIGASTLGKTGSLALSGGISGGLFGLSDGDDIDPKRIFTSTAMGAVAAPAMNKFGEAVSKGVGKATKKINLKRAGKLIEEEGKDYAVRSSRISQPQQNNFKAKTGKEVADFQVKNNLYGQNLDQVDELIKPLEQARAKAIKEGNPMVNPQEVIEAFNAEIAKLDAPGKASVPANKLRKKALEEARDMFADDAVNYAQQNGDETLSQYPLQLLDETRSNIDATTPKAQFMSDPVAYGNSRKIGNVYRNFVNDRAGTREMGLKLRDLYAYRDALEKAPKGKNTLPFGLNRGMWGVAGATATNLPIVGTAVGMAGEAIANNPGVIGATSRGIQRVGRAMQNLPNVAIPQLPAGTSTAASRMLTAGATGAMNPQQQQATQSRQQTVQYIASMGVTDPKQIADMLNEASAQTGYSEGNWTAQEVAQYLPQQPPLSGGFYPMTPPPTKFKAPELRQYQGNK